MVNLGQGWRETESGRKVKGVFGPEAGGGGAAEKKLRGEGVKRNEGGRKGVGFHSTLELMVSFIHTQTT